MSEGSTEDRLADRARSLFEASVERLDAATVSRLNRQRRLALAELARARTVARWALLLPAMGIVAAAILTVMIFPDPEPVNVTATVTGADFELLLDQDALEMLEELDFYSWLEAQDFETNGNVG